MNKIRVPLQDSIVPLGEQESKQIATIHNSRNKQVVNGRTSQIPWADSEGGQVTPSDLRDQKNFVKEMDFEQWLDGGGGGFQDTQSREGQREQHEQRLRVVGGWRECSGSSGRAGRIG